MSRLLSMRLDRLAKETTMIAVEVFEMEVDSEPNVKEPVGDNETKNSGIEHYVEAMNHVVRKEHTEGQIECHGIQFHDKVIWFLVHSLCQDI
jgi:hypothetical protein